MLPPGVRFGPYEIVEPLGVGAMGEVYKARDTRLGRIVAIKVLPADVAHDPHRYERFKREARVVSSLSHAHICTLHDVGEQDGVSYLVMECLAGETLARRLVRGPLPLPEILRIGGEIAGALEAAYRQGVVHRDLKPANVMLTPDGAKILDFGVAKWRDPAELPAGDMAGAGSGDPTLTQAGSVVGTIQYMAPEQLEGHSVDGRSDLFALGAILYEMTTGRRAFDAPTPGGVMAAIRTVTPPSMSTRGLDVSPAFERLVQKCLAKDPARRWQTAADLRDELDWIAHLPERVGDVEQRRRSHWGRWVVLILGLGVAAGLYAFMSSRNRLTTSPPTSFVMLPPEGVTDVEHPTISPDGRTVAFVGTGADGHTSLWVRRLEALDARSIADADEFAFPFWSPDSRYLAFFFQGQLMRIDAAGGVPQVICAATAGRGGTWGRGGIIIFAPSTAGPLSQVPASGGTPVQLTALDAATAEQSHRFPQFLADSQFLYTAYSLQADRRPVVKVSSLGAPTVASRLIETSERKTLMASGRLLFSRERGGSYVAQPFNRRTLQVSGDAVPIADRVVEGPIDGGAAVSASENDVLAYERTVANRVAHLTWVDRTGQRLATVGDRASIGQEFEFESFSLSPDGSRVATAHRDGKTGLSDIWVVDIQRPTASRVTTNGVADDPRWSGDGNQIAFVKNQHGSGKQDLYVARWSGVWSEKPLLISSSFKYVVDWSRDGTSVLFNQQDGASPVSSLWVLSTREQVPTQYLRTGFHLERARLSPDLRWVAYDSDESGRAEVYVQAYPDPGTRYQVSVAGGTRPRWATNGRELFYVAAAGTIMAAPIQLGRSNPIGTAKALFSLSAKDDSDLEYEVAPDGQRLLITTVIRPPVRSPITVVMNWSAGLTK